jgi:periplasmic protein TonB
MTWLKRTLPVSALVHMAAALSLSLLPALSGDALPEPKRELLTVLEGPPMLVPARPAFVVRAGGGRRSQVTSPQLPAAREMHAPPNPTYDPTGQRADEVVDDPGPTDLDVGEPGSDVGLSMIGGGSLGKNGSGDGSGAPQTPVRPGGDLKPPTKLRHVAPAYPELARRAGIEGVVVLECVIDPSGHVADVKVLRGHPLLEAAAVDAVGQWLYASTRLNGLPVAVLLTVTVRFTIPR